MSNFIEGGGEFIDYRDPKKIFKTKDPKKWDEHLRSTNATYSGTAPCGLCNNPVTFENLRYGIKPVCDSCKGSIGK